MPLEKAPAGSAGFKRNIKREIEAGKPQKQAVAIAYSKSRERGKDDVGGGHIEMPSTKPKMDTEQVARAVPKPDGDLIIKHLSDTEEEKFRAACDRSDSISHRMDQLEKRDAIRSLSK